MKRRFYILLVIFFASNILRAGLSDDSQNKISSFNAKIKKNEVELNFQIINPQGISKYRVESKRSGEVNYKFLNDILFSNFRKKEVTDSVNVYYYSYFDKPSENGVYLYRISMYDLGNKVIKSEEIKVGISEVPEFELLQNNPNPFNPSTIISYKLLVPTRVKLSVYTLTGKYVDLLVEAFQSPGIYKVEFNTSKYSEISSGIYFYKLESNYTVDIGKMIFTK
ncbi:MAG: T9SS type A sorting domain-containing protein [Bacteroidetes bacterium]|nr:T9SS type A sorting domain-containing protein [Bacteroidota bacterium]